MSPLENKSVREDESSIFYSLCEGSLGVTLTVLKVGEEHVACDITTHTPSPYRGDPCSVWGGLPAVCTGHSVAFARGFYRELQHGVRERVDDEVVFTALMTYARQEQGDDA